jgi:hypothetical protein
VEAKLKVPIVDPSLVKALDQMYPPLEYNKDNTKEDWAFRGGQRAVVLKLKQLIISQERG